MNANDFTRILTRHKRVAIAGGPRTGKTTLASYARDRPVYHTDDAMGYGWADQPQFWIDRTRDKETFVIEGIQVGRLLRKGFVADAVVVLTEPHAELTPGQQAMTKGCDKILNEALSLNPQLTVYYDGRG